MPDPIDGSCSKVPPPYLCDPDAKGAFFESPAGKNYRHATYYTATEGVKHL